MRDHGRSKWIRRCALVVQVDALGGDIRAEQESHCPLGVAEVLHDALLVDVAHAAVKHLDLSGLEFQVSGEMRLQPVQGGDAFGEDDEAVGRVGIGCHSKGCPPWMAASSAWYLA